MPVASPEIASTHASSDADLVRLQTGLKAIERREVLLVWAALIVILVLTFAVVALSLPQLFSGEQNGYPENLKRALRGLVALVVLFDFYTLYQQYLLRRMRRQMASGIDLIIRLQTEAKMFHELAMVDPLTGLYNRRLAEHRLAGEVSRSQRYGHPLTVLLLDLNGFKEINDQYGHAAGDTVLQSFATRLLGAIRAADLAVRMGGDEFLAVLPECREEELQDILKRLRGLCVAVKSAGASATSKMIELPITFASGSASYHADESPQTMLQRADEALYTDKRAQKVAAPNSDWTADTFPAPS
jgi:diguanylate cyclase (GGDEF)-like protein